MMTLKKSLTTVTLLGSLFAASSVFAHAHLKSQSPAADSTVSAPAELRLVFSEGVEATFTKVTSARTAATYRLKAWPPKAVTRKPWW